MPSSRRPARLSIAGRPHERLPGLELVTTRTVFSSTLMYRLHWMRYPLGRSGYFWQFCLLSLLVLVSSRIRLERTNGRDVCFCCYISVCCCEERAADVFCIYLPACLLKHTCCLQEQDRWMDGYPPPPRDTRRRRRQEGDENGEEMHNTYLPTRTSGLPSVGTLHIARHTPTRRVAPADEIHHRHSVLQQTAR